MHPTLLVTAILGISTLLVAAVAGLRLRGSGPVTRQRAFRIFRGEPAQKRAAVLLGLLWAGDVSATTVQALWPHASDLPPLHPYVELVTTARRAPRLLADVEARFQRDVEALRRGTWTAGRAPMALEAA